MDRPTVARVAGGLALFVLLLYLLVPASDEAPRRGGGGGGVGGGGSVGGGAPSAASSGGGRAPADIAGHAQPVSRRTVYFDAAALGGFREVPLATSALGAPAAGERCERWVVVTSVNGPTPAVQKLATLPGWRVVVVGDSKTPAGWSWPNVTFLDLAAQAALGYSTHALLRTRAYTRKNLGYIYAVHRGARVIYETDDDNALIGDALAPLATSGGLGAGSARVLEYAAGELTVNHHVHFAQPGTWPRGYPLESVGAPPLREVREATVLPGVQQGLANGDPDMDAIFRLTRKPHGKRIDFFFAPDAAPVALPPGSFGPFNAQNTLFTYEALWATVLPQTVEFRVCDIWRAFYVQRLLWGVGAQLVFMPATVYQLRNSHSYLEDYISEKQIYEQVSDLLAFLRAWRCAGPDLPACAAALARDMASAGYWGPADAELVRHFMHDLARVGYAFPPWLETAESKHFAKACERAQPPHACQPLGPPIVEPLRMLPSIDLFSEADIAAAAAAGL
jgi:hypothetical protein